MRSCLVLLFTALLFACNTAPENITIDGILEVPENRDDPNSRKLKLVYKVLKAKDTTSSKAPLVYLQGGPGGATLGMEAMWKNHPLRNDRDIVLMDQRGTGKSEANCIEMGNSIFNIIKQDLDQKGEIKAMEAILSKCKTTLKKEGVDLAGYTSKENAADFEDLRKALGYDKWNLWGVSYGSRLGLTIMRDFPNSVRSAMLAGILAPENDPLNDSIKNFENSLFSVLNRCEINEDCSKRYPNLKERLLKTLRKLETEPLHFDYKGKPFTLNQQEALMVMYMPLYDHNSIADIPLLIEALETRDAEPIKNVMKNVEIIYHSLNWPMNYSVMIYEEFPFYDRAAMEETLKNSEIVTFEPVSLISSEELTDSWHSFRATDFENKPVVSDIPTLMISGGLDHVTPVSNASRALKHLKNGYEVLFPDDGHNLYNPCFFQIAEEFLNNPSLKPNIDCSSKRKPIEWNLSNPIQ